MNIQVHVDDQIYEVEVGDLQARPIVVTVAGEAYEVWPDETPLGTGLGSPARTPPGKVVPLGPPRARPVASPERTLPAPAAAARPYSRALCAPLPGVVVAVTAQPGQQIAAGQELCVLEAMKMLNTIRAPRAGQIAAVHVTIGQHVQHNDPLIEYDD
jgi:biotin carboxyl carrier protein